MTTTAMNHPSAESTPFDEAAARREGWVVSGCGVDDFGRRRIELQRLDNPKAGEGTFPDVLDAWRHVAARARGARPCTFRPWPWSIRSSGR